jgi:putative ABC transport system substrate-binding protein
VSPHTQARQWRPYRGAGRFLDRASCEDHIAGGALRMPAVYPFRFFAESGGLLSYGNDLLDNCAQRSMPIASSRAKPSEMPVQDSGQVRTGGSTLKTTKTLGLDVPLQLQQRADGVIQ